MTVLTNARLVDLTSRQVSEPTAVRLTAGRVASGRTSGPSAGDETVDLEGRYVLPGLWDTHVHLGQWALTAHRLDVSAAGSALEAVALVRAALGDLAPGEPLVGYGFRAATWTQQPTSALLDEVSGERRVVLLSGDLHGAWLNSAAARAYGFADHPTGHLREEDAFAVERRLSAPDEATLDRFVAEATRDAAARGIVGIVDVEFADNLTAWRRRMGHGTPSVRVEAGFYAAQLDSVITAGHRSGSLVDAALPLLTVGPLKVIADGSLTTRTAFCRAPYPDGTHGQLTIAPTDLHCVMRRATEAGLRCAVHAIGDRAVTVVLDAFVVTAAHGSVEHAQLVGAGDIARFASLGVAASVQPAHLLDDRDTADALWGERCVDAFPLRRLLDAGATLTFGSDAPVAPLEPWLAVQAAVQRTIGARPPWYAGERITLAEALLATTRGVRRVTPGSPADLVIVNANPLQQLDPGVAATYVAGQPSYTTLE